MSTVESVFWHVLGYSAIPLIVFAGVVLASLVYFLLLKWSGRLDDK
jgi:uncharacterized protein (TIGR02808 family)